ncbi:hypothetical protein KSP39_PZI014756 [Platanthera zijinensis]|uniref:Uncharacterized protein n=1 Tax=Platanthera zijinensis TaxID=2320716 RepID=A0AAP0G2S3_9ASPA
MAELLLPLIPDAEPSLPYKIKKEVDAAAAHHGDRANDGDLLSSFSIEECAANHAEPDEKILGGFMGLFVPDFCYFACDLIGIDFLFIVVDTQEAPEDVEIEDIEIDIEFSPVEHPIEPISQDQPVRCPLPEPSVLNVGFLDFHRYHALTPTPFPLPCLDPDPDPAPVPRPRCSDTDCATPML